MKQENDIELQHDISSFLGMSNCSESDIARTIVAGDDTRMQSFLTLESSDVVDDENNGTNGGSSSFEDNSFLATTSCENAGPIRGVESKEITVASSTKTSSLFHLKDVFTCPSNELHEVHSNHCGGIDDQTVKQTPTNSAPVSYKDQLRYHPTDVESTLETNPPLAHAVAVSFSLPESSGHYQRNQARRQFLGKNAAQWILAFLVVAATVATTMILTDSRRDSSGTNNDIYSNSTGAAPIVDNASNEGGEQSVIPLLEQQVKLLPAGLQPQDRFGESVALSGDLLVVGSVHTALDNTRKSGIVHIYRRTRGIWNEETTLMPSDPHEDLRFGRSVAIEGATVAVGAYFDNHMGPYTGSVYIFEQMDNGSWIESQKLVASDATEDSLFGLQVAMSHGTLVVTAPNDRNHTGAVYVFEKIDDEWTQIQKITASDESQDIHFGYSLALDEKSLVIGAREGSAQEYLSGSVYVFQRSQGSKWIEEQKVWADDTIVEDSFGYRVSVFGDFMVIGAPGDNDNGSSSGSAYVFVYDGSNWIQSQKLLRPTEALHNDRFGDGVAIDSSDGKRFVVGFRSSLNRETGGGGYVYEQRGDGVWDALYQLHVSGKQDNEVRRFVPAIDDGTIVFTSPFSTTSVGERSGIGYVFRL